jgi:universal stress protein A
MRSEAQFLAGPAGVAEPRIRHVLWVDDAAASPARTRAVALELSRRHEARLSRVAVGGAGTERASLDAILAGSASVDLIVMGDGGCPPGSRVGRADRVLRRAGCAVLLVRSGLGHPLRILCPIEFSEVSLASLGWAAALARAAGVGLVLVHVFEWFPDEPRDQDSLLVTELHTDLAVGAREGMRKLGRQVGVEVEALVATGSPHRQILRVSRARAIDLIVLGAHARRGVDRQLPGGTMCHVLRQAECSVLSVLPP